MKTETILEDVRAGRQSDPSIIALAKELESEREAHLSLKNTFKLVSIRLRAQLSNSRFADLEPLLKN